jgi:hypothetical protein
MRHNLTRHSASGAHLIFIYSNANLISGEKIGVIKGNGFMELSLSWISSYSP